MKKALCYFAAMTMVASSAMASKARVSSLSHSWAILETDPQTVFINPAVMHYVGDFATFEFGKTSTTAVTAVTGNPNAEGGFINTIGDAKFGVYLGRMDTMNAVKAMAAGYSVNFLQSENPIDVFYGSRAGDLNWGVAFNYTNSDRKSTDQKQSGMGLTMGVKTDDWAGYANVGLGGTASVADYKLEGKVGLRLGGNYNMDNMKYYVDYQQVGSEISQNGNKLMNVGRTITEVGFTNAWKSDGNIAFYGLAFNMLNQSEDVAKDKTATTTLPFTLGTEVLAAPWLKLRGSVSQNILVGSKKVEKPADTTQEVDGSVNHDTKTAAGAGFIWGRNTVDVAMDMGVSGDFNAANFGAQASYTYTF